MPRVRPTSSLYQCNSTSSDQFVEDTFLNLGQVMHYHESLHPVV